jgi:hypothetical protein
MRRAFLFALLLTAAACGNGIAQPVSPAQEQGVSCPPGVGRDAPAIGRQSDKPLSDQLAASKGVICPPAGIDPQIQQRPPEGGTMKVIPPPGSPGGNPNVQPK